MKTSISKEWNNFRNGRADFNTVALDIFTAGMFAVQPEVEELTTRIKSLEDSEAYWKAQYMAKVRYNK